jgi:PqqD family protein of HPr-rel-A system
MDKRYREVVWEDGVVVYDMLSGDTHFLDVSLYAALARLRQQGIAGRIEDGSQAVGDDAEVTDPLRLDALRDQLHRAHLI